MTEGLNPERARRLLGAGSRDAFEAGAAPLLLDAFNGPVAKVLVEERAPSYVTLLYALLLLRRDHEIEPLHDDIERFVAPAAHAADPAWDGQALVRDLEQLRAWGALERRAEPLRIRGYKDVRRERFRYRLTDDAVAMLEWLEARLQARLEGRARDSRDLLIDVVGAAKELARVVGHFHRGERSDEAPRRALHLLAAIDDSTHAISEELIAFRASMLLFAARPYDLAALRAILAWLERYVAVYLARVETLRTEITSKLDELAAPRFRRALAELHALAERERSETPTAFRASGVLRDPGETLEAERAFFADHGRLVELCARIDESVRAVLRKMHRHLRELERRSARVQDLRARVLELAALSPDVSGEAMAAFANAIVGSAHARFGTRKAYPDARFAPALPRAHRASADRGTRRPLSEKRLAPDAARALRARRLADLAAWLDTHLLLGRAEVRLSEVQLDRPDAPRRWLDVARARHLDQGRDLKRLAVGVQAAEGVARIGGASPALVAPDCVVSKRAAGTRT